MKCFAIEVLDDGMSLPLMPGALAALTACSTAWMQPERTKSISREIAEAGSAPTAPVSSSGNATGNKSALSACDSA